MNHTIIIGGGAAGFFSAITIKEKNPRAAVTILEKSQKLLAKVRISGGGRCNVTHACFDPRQLISYYPRGRKELLSPFLRFQPRDTMQWFESKGVTLKIEPDGRVFPVSNNSIDIVNALMDTAKNLGVEILTGQDIKSIAVPSADKDFFTVATGAGNIYRSTALIVAAGSSGSMWDILAELGHTIVPPVPSLFTFNLAASDFSDLPGISVPAASLYIPELKLRESGPLLITHWGLSGPAVLKISSFGARELAETQYRFHLHVNWTGAHKTEEVYAMLLNQKTAAPSLRCSKSPLYNIPQSLWQRLLFFADIDSLALYKDIANKKLRSFAEVTTNNILQVSGKSTFKEEFVTCGGVALKEINFKTMESKTIPRMFLAGEVVDIDAVTGGFNFQAAWTCGYIAGTACSEL